MKISATIIAQDEERNIARAIEQVRWADEIIVVDSGSSDRTREIATAMGARVFEESWRGYAAQKNHAATLASHDWIFSLDADEAPSAALQDELRAFQETPPDHAAYSVPRLSQFMGRWIRHSGWYPDRKVRLYDRRQAHWSGDHVHERIVCTTPVGALTHDLLHYAYPTLSGYLAKTDRYTTLAAQQLVADGRRVGVADILSRPAFAFVKSLILRQGYRDGLEGLLIARTAAYYVGLKYAKAYYLARDASAASSPTRPDGAA